MLCIYAIALTDEKKRLSIKLQEKPWKSYRMSCKTIPMEILPLMITL